MGRTGIVEFHQDEEIQDSAEASALSCLSDVALRVPCYCEENVWRLVYRRLKEDNDSMTGICKYYVVFISNAQKCCPMYAQKAKEDRNAPCFWDYHVILICCVRESQSLFSRETENPGHQRIETEPENYEKSRAYVFDMDSQLNFPCSFSAYFDETFRNLDMASSQYGDQFAPLFRVVEAELYLKHFYSDRMHMFNSSDGSWCADPPSYRCIMNGLKAEHRNMENGRTSNLDDYISMDRLPFCPASVGIKGQEKNYGEVFSLNEMRQRFT